MVAVCHLGFSKNWKCQPPVGFREPKCVTVPSFMKINRTFAGTWQFNHYIIIPSIRPCPTEVRASYGRLSCGWLLLGLRVATLATVGSGRGWLGTVVGRHVAGRNGRCASNGGFLNSRCVSTVGFLTLQFKMAAIRS